MPTTIGYIRASAADPPSVIEEQRKLLAWSPYRPDRMFADRGNVLGQPQLRACLAALGAGDVLVATSGDRLAHSVDAMLAMEDGLQRRGVGLVLLAFNGAVVDFRTEEAKPVLKLMCEISRWHYRGLRERQHAGIAQARQEGRYRGRRAVIPAEDVRQRLQAGERPSAVARDLGIARSTVYRLAGDRVAASITPSRALVPPPPAPGRSPSAACAPPAPAGAAPAPIPGCSLG